MSVMRTISEKGGEKRPGTVPGLFAGRKNTVTEEPSQTGIEKRKGVRIPCCHATVMETKAVIATGSTVQTV
jgi:hypothetical protein